MGTAHARWGVRTLIGEIATWCVCVLEVVFGCCDSSAPLCSGTRNTKQSMQYGLVTLCMYVHVYSVLVIRIRL